MLWSEPAGAIASLEHDRARRQFGRGEPRVLDAVSPHAGENFDPETFLTQSGTLYLLATGAGAGASSALVAALIEDLVETARRLAARSAGIAGIG